MKNSIFTRKTQNKNGRGPKKYLVANEAESKTVYLVAGGGEYRLKTLRWVFLQAHSTFELITQKLNL